MEREFEADFELTASMRDEILSRYGKNPSTTDFSEFERVVMLVTAIDGEINNGGFEQLFSSTFPGDPKFKFALQAFEQIGCKEAIDSFRNALGLFPDGEPPEDDALRIEQYKKHPQEIRDVINSKFWKEHEEIVRKLAAYIRLKQSH